MDLDPQAKRLEGSAFNDRLPKPMAGRGGLAQRAPEELSHRNNSVRHRYAGVSSRSAGRGERNSRASSRQILGTLWVHQYLRSAQGAPFTDRGHAEVEGCRILKKYRARLFWHFA